MKAASRNGSPTTSIHTRGTGGRAGSASGNHGTTSPHMSALTDEELTVHCTDLAARERALNVEVTAALEECQRRHAARVAAAAPRAEARVA